MTFAHVVRDRALLVVAPRASLAQEPDTTVALGHAPDGLPLALHVRRRLTLESSVLAALGNPPRAALPPDVDAALRDLESAAQRHARAAGIVPTPHGDAYRTAATVGLVLGDTMLSRALGAHSPVLLLEDRYAHGGAPPELAAATMASAHAAIDPGAADAATADRYLAVPLADERAPFVSRGRDAETAAAGAGTSLILEDVRAVPSARFWYASPRGEGEGSLADERAYYDAVRVATSLRWSVARADVGQLLVTLGHALALLHRDGWIHGDVKPANALVTREGAIPIDPLRTRVGAVAAAATPGWAAPEQILARPVAPATDVFALGLIAARLVDGALFGEERSFVLPTGGAGRRRVRLLAQPEVYVDASAGLDEPGRRAWQSFLAGCVAFEPERRPRDAGAFASELAELLARHPPPGRFDLRAGPGQLVDGVEFAGRTRPVWVVTDARDAFAPQGAPAGAASLPPLAHGTPW